MLDKMLKLMPFMHVLSSTRDTCRQHTWHCTVLLKWHEIKKKFILEVFATSS